MGIYVCRKCDQEYDDEDTFIGHMLVCRNQHKFGYSKYEHRDYSPPPFMGALISTEDNITSYECRPCDLNFPNEDALMNHLTTAQHNEKLIDILQKSSMKESPPEENICMVGEQLLINCLYLLSVRQYRYKVGQGIFCTYCAGLDGKHNSECNLENTINVLRRMIGG